MSISRIISRLVRKLPGASPLATEADIATLRDVGFSLPAQVMELYVDAHGIPRRQNELASIPPLRLMPLCEAVATTQELRSTIADLPAINQVFWLWSDDQSNYIGTFCSGSLAGWLTTLNHEEPLLVPSYRNVSGLLQCMQAAPRTDSYPYLYNIPRQIPSLTDDAATLVNDRRLSDEFQCLAREERDSERRGAYAATAMALTPFQDTPSVVRYFDDEDTWIPELAVGLLELRQIGSCVPELERLAFRGKPNGNGAAMRFLVRMNTPESHAAVQRLSEVLSGDSLTLLKFWISMSDRLQPPCWP